jgi:N-acetylglutamate synthase-like GNAT family acetyltransferase
MMYARSYLVEVKVLEIRRYQPVDNAAVRELHFAGLRQMYEFTPGVKRPDIPGLDADLDNIEEEYFHHRGDFLVGLENGEVVAMGAVSSLSAACGEIRRIRVQRDRQRRGHAGAIMRALLARAGELGYKRLILDSMVENTPAHRLFEQFGFTCTHRGAYGHVEVLYFVKEMEKTQMDMNIKEKFLKLWKKYFNDSPLPITFYYTDNPPEPPAKAGSMPRCIIGGIVKVQQGQTIVFDAANTGCPGGKSYLGFGKMTMPNFEYFLSCGIPGKLEGERYLKTPEMVKEYMKHQGEFKAPAKTMVFKRWDMLEETDNPEVVIFLAAADVLAGLFTLAIYDEASRDAVIVPFGSGCASIVKDPYLEIKQAYPRAVIGMFDLSARPFVPKDTISFAVPMTKFTRMVENMEESFLITDSWRKVQKRIK